jgi:hypothetical protein
MISPYFLHELIIEVPSGPYDVSAHYELSCEESFAVVAIPLMVKIETSYFFSSQIPLQLVLNEAGVVGFQPGLVSGGVAGLPYFDSFVRPGFNLFFKPFFSVSLVVYQPYSLLVVTTSPAPPSYRFVFHQ